MPFETLPTITVPLKQVKASISYMRFNGTSKLGKKYINQTPKLLIGIPKAVAAGAIMPAVQASGHPSRRAQGRASECLSKNQDEVSVQSYVLQLGQGADAGKARLVPGAGGVVPRALKGGLAFRFGYVPMLGDGAAARELVDIKALPGGGFEIVLPKWFTSDAE